MNKSVLRKYPRSMPFADSTVELRLMTAADGPAFTAFIQTLPTHDLLFVRRDISHPKVIAAWMEAIEQGRLHSLVAFHGDELVGCAAIVVDDLSWSRHVGELRVLSAPSWRGRGLGRWLIQESFAVALGLELEKLTVQMTVDQTNAIAAFEELGFRPEAVLTKQVKDRDGKAYDIALLSHDVTAVQSLMEIFGLPESLGN
ncbi:Acetyltransferase (GNAT) family protein [compost metagenome]